MSIFLKIMETVVQFVPDQKPDQLIQKTNYVGRPIDRVDGQLKVTGEAKFTAEYALENICYAALAYSSVAKGKLKTLHTEAARQSEGVISVITHENTSKAKKPILLDPSGESRGTAAMDITILQDEHIYWNGQPIAVVVADTQEQAEQAAALITAEYEAQEAKLSFNKEKEDAKTPPRVMTEPTKVDIGNAEKALKMAACTTDQLYHTPRYNHNAIEPHATIAAFKDDGNLVIFDTTQMLYGVKRTIADMYKLEPEKVQVIAPFVGGGFGGKGSVWFHTMVCVMAAEQTGRPVKLALSREGVFRLVGGRTPSEQRVAIGADENGKFVSLIHTGVTATTEHNDFPEQFSFPARHLYAAENIYITQKITYLNTVANTFMRAPGESIGTFALESAMDELAHRMNMDPVELRALNEPKEDPVKKTPFSSRHLTEAYRRGAEAFGWKHQLPELQRDGEWLIGQGVATAYYPYYRFPATVRMALYADGTAVVKAAAHEMGMGTATVQLQHAADRLGLDIEKVSFEYGDSNLPEASFAGGSNQTASIAAGIAATAEKLLKSLFDEALKHKDFALHDLDFEETEVRDGGIYSRKDPAKGASYQLLFQLAGKAYLQAEASSSAPLELQKYSMGSYGAQFAEVRVNKITGEVRISRWVASFDSGRVINPKTAVSQFRGGIIMGIGMALTEETFFDERTGRIMNPSLAEYHVPVHADVPHIEVLFNDIPDEHTPLGGHGIGEIGITGTAAAIANAVFNATGKRIRSLPITLDKILEE
ncbi:xanthine dehydrogenase family protein molybdopterin-binding subunit [Mucilaginibacter sp.]